MKPRAILTIGLPLLGAALAALVANQWITKQLGGKTESVELTPVVATATDIAAGTEIDATQVKLVSLPPDSVPSGSYKAIGEVVGKVSR